ncbi:MAG: ABC transporter permease [Acidimicrobiia bacterium]
MFKFTVKSLLSHKARVAMTVFGVLLGVAFVSGAFILSDGLNKSFDKLFNDVYGGIDTQVRAKVAFGDATTASPVDASLLDTINKVDGVDVAEGSLGDYALLIDADGEAIKPVGGPALGVNTTGDDKLSSARFVDGERPQGEGEIAVDAGTADRKKLKVGNRIEVITVTGRHPVEITGLFKVGSSSGLAGATVTAFDTATAQKFFNMTGKFNSIDIAAKPGVSGTELADRINKVLPPNVEAVDRKTVVDDNTKQLDSFISIIRNVILGFAFVTLFVSAFLINNTFSIIIGQRIREFALLRALGGSGRQITRMIIGESLMIGTIATLIGVPAGIAIAKLITALFNSTGGGFPNAPIVIGPRTIIAALVVGYGITLLAALAPALRARRVPPVAAMRDGFSLHGGPVKVRLTIAAIALVVGAAIFAWAVFTTPGGGLQTATAAGFGGVLAFLGIAGLSNLIARPVVHMLGKPVEKLFRFSGVLATENAARNPRRTASTASALMIGLALAGGFLVLGESTKQSIKNTLESAVKADFLINDPSSFQGFSAKLGEDLAKQPELDTVSVFQGGQGVGMQVDGDTKSITAADGETLDAVLNLGVTAGKTTDLVGDTLMIQKDVAKKLGVGVGDTIQGTFQSTGTTPLKVVALYKDASLLGNWVISLDTYAKNFTNQNDVFVAATIKDGVDIEAARAAVEKVTDQYPTVDMQDKVEFNKAAAGRVNQGLIVINGLLFLALTIAVIGIANTLALSVFERTREIGLLRAVGMTRRQTRRAIRWEAVLVAVFGAVIGIVVGTLFGVSITSAMPESFISTVQIPFGQMLFLIVIAILAGIVAALFPAWRAGRMKVLDAISYE